MIHFKSEDDPLGRQTVPKTTIRSDVHIQIDLKICC